MKIIHSADWQLHKDNAKRALSFDYAKNKYLDILDTEFQGLDPQDRLQVIVGDIFENYTDITNDSLLHLYRFLMECLRRSDVIVVLGNHDYDHKNPNKTNVVETLKELIDNEGFVFLDTTGCYLHSGIVWVNYAHKEGSNRPKELSTWKDMHPDKLFVGLYHDPIQNAKTLYGDFSDYPKSLDIFQGCDCVMAGDIHQRQAFDFGQKSFVYPGSPYQLSHGESLANHGVVVWETTPVGLNYRYVDIHSPHNYVTIQITDKDDIKNNNFTIKNA